MVHHDRDRARRHGRRVHCAAHAVALGGDRDHAYCDPFPALGLVARRAGGRVSLDQSGRAVRDAAWRRHRLLRAEDRVRRAEDQPRLRPGAERSEIAPVIVAQTTRAVGPPCAAPPLSPNFDLSGWNCPYPGVLSSRGQKPAGGTSMKAKLLAALAAGALTASAIGVRAAND